MRSIAWLDLVNRRFRKEPSPGRFHRLAVRVMRYCLPDFHEFPDSTRQRPVAIRLGRNGVIQLGENCGARCLQVRRGMVWLTGTPARNDVVLQTGNRFQLTGEWPFVLQAIGDAEIDLLP